MALNYNKKGSVNYTIEGTPTIVDGVVSGFSDSNYVKTSSDLDVLASANTFEKKICFTVASTPDTAHMICQYGKTDGSFLLAAFKQGNNNFRLRWYINSSSSIFAATPTNNLAFNTPYYLILKFTGTQYKMLLSTDDKNYTEIYNFDSTAKIGVSSNYKAMAYGVDQRGTWSPLNGSIDFNNTYISIDGQAWFGVCPVEVKHINYGTSVGYTKVGSPTINNGVVSGFSSSDYLRIYNFQDSGTSCELNFTFTTPSSASNSCLFYANNFRAFFAYNGTRLNVVFNSGGSQETGYIDYTFDYGIKYTVNILRNGITAFVKIYKGTTLEKEVETPNISAFNNGNSITMVMGYENVIFATPFLGSIDLNHTYIKVNGKLWLYRPVTNYLVKDGKLVFADSDVYIDDNGTKTYASANIAPVPSGFTYGTTTTTDVGLVNMVTQAFTAVPGATWGKD